MLFSIMNDNINYLVICIITIVIGLFAIVNVIQNRGLFKGEYKEFLALIISTIVVSVFDYLVWLFDDESIKGGYNALKFVTFAFYIYQTLPGLCWLLFLLKKYLDDEKYVKYAFLSIIPFAIITVLCLISLDNGMIFTITKDINVYGNTVVRYARGSINYLYVIFLISYAVLAYVALFFLRGRIGNRELRTYALAPAFSLFCGVLQAFIYGIDIYILSIAFMALITVVAVMKEALMTDDLTKLYNRRQLEYYLNRNVEKRQSRLRKKYLIGIMLDLDKFKSINDTYGHGVGDEALEDASLIIRNSFSKDAFLARYAGDEFVIVVLTNEENEAEKIEEKIRFESRKFNESNNKVYTLTFSIGALQYDLSKKFTPKAFLAEIDEAMYKDKKLNEIKKKD